MRPTNSKARISLGMALIGLGFLVCCGVGAFLSLPAAIFGHLARREIGQSGEAGAGYATTGILIGWLGFLTGAAFIAALLMHRITIPGEVACRFIPCEPNMSP
ncbi:DUF4190 domain-containing protein [Micromonospora sp. U56]|nr:DUF4190 domain-containing protein [Micromonospora sp. U56]